MNKTLKFTLTTAWIVLTRAYDAYCTHQLTPDLSKEANPLVSILEMGWTPLLLTIGILIIYILYAYFISVFRPKNILPSEKGYSFSEFIAFLYLGKKDHWSAIFYKLPKDMSRFNTWIGHIFSRSLVFAGAVSTIMWILINHTEFYKKIHSAPIIYSILILGCFAIILLWNKKLYKNYLTEVK